MSLLVLRIAGFDEYAAHPLLPDMSKVINTTSKGSYVHYRLSCLNEDIAPLDLEEWKDMPGNALARQATNFSIWTTYDSRTDTSHVEYERVLHRLRFIHPSNTSYSLWYASSNINRDRVMCEHVHNCRNPWYSMIQEYKNISDARKILWNKEQQKEEQERIKALGDKYSDICQFRIMCDIEFVDFSAMNPGTYEHHKLSAIIEKAEMCLSEHAWRSLHGIERIGGYYIDTSLISPRKSGENTFKYWSSRPQNDYVLSYSVAQPISSASTNDDKVKRVEEVLRGMIGTTLWDKEKSLYIQLYSYKKDTADVLTAAKWKSVQELVDLLADKTEWRIGFKQKASLNIEITSTSPALTCLYLANICTSEYDSRKIRSVAADVKLTSHIGRFASFLRRIREGGAEYVKEAVSLILEGFGKEQQMGSANDMDIGMIMRLGTPDHFTIIYKEEATSNNREKIQKNIFHSSHTTRRLITNENTTTFTLYEISEWGVSHKRAMVMQSSDTSCLFFITDKPCNAKLHEEVLSSVHDRLLKALEERKFAKLSSDLRHEDTLHTLKASDTSINLLERISVTTSATHLLITSVPNGPQWEEAQQIQLVDNILAKLGLLIHLPNKLDNIIKSIQQPIHNGSDSSLVSIIINLEDNLHASDKDGSIMVNNEPYELLMAIEAISRCPYKEHRRFDGIFIHAVDRPTVEIIRTGKRALFFRNLLRAPGSQIAQRNAIAIWLERRMKESRLIHGQYFIAFHNKYHKMPGEHFFTEHMAVLWCKHEDVNAFTSLVGSRKSEMIFQCAGLNFEMYNTEPRYLFPRCIPEYSIPVCIRGLDPKYSLLDILSAILATGHYVYNIWFEGLQRLQELGLITANERLPNKVYVLMENREAVFDLMNSELKHMTHGAKLYTSCVSLPDTSNEALCFAKKVGAFYFYCQRLSKLPYVLKDQINAYNACHDTGVVPFNYEYAGKGARLFSKKVDATAVTLKRTANQITIDNDTSYRVAELVTTVNALLASQAATEKHNASLQAQLNIQKQRQEEMEYALQEKKSEDIEAANKRDAAFKALETQVSNTRQSELKLQTLMEEAKTRFKNIEDANSAILQIMLSKNMINTGSHDSSGQNE